MKERRGGRRNFVKLSSAFTILFLSGCIDLGDRNNESSNRSDNTEPQNSYISVPGEIIDGGISPTSEIGGSVFLVESPDTLNTSSTWDGDRTRLRNFLDGTKFESQNIIVIQTVVPRLCDRLVLESTGSSGGSGNQSNGVELRLTIDKPDRNCPTESTVVNAVVRVDRFDGPIKAVVDRGDETDVYYWNEGL